MKWLLKIPPYILLTIKVFLFQFIAFSIFRLIFFAFTSSANSLPTPTLLKLTAFRMGFEFDMVVICYMLLPVFLLLCLHSLITRKLFKKLIFVLLFISILLFDLIYTIDIPYYLQFGNHLNKQALLWESSPGFVLGMVFGNFSYWGYLFIFIVFGFISYKILQKLFNSYQSHIELHHKYKPVSGILLFIIGAGLLVIGARGRISPKSTTHEGLAVISDNGYINNLGLNPNFTFIRSLIADNTDVYKTPSDIDKRIAYTRTYLGINTPFQKNIERTDVDTAKPRQLNVVVVIMESMCMFKMGYYNGPNLTPQFNSIIKESAFFNKFFSSGIHTFNGNFSTASGYPAIMSEQSLMHYRKSAFASLPVLLKKDEYEGYFFTTHDPHFDNMSGFYQLNGFKNIYSQYDMPSEKAISTLGVPDHVLFDKFIETINSRTNTTPFVTYIMTASDHGPWKVPDDIPFKPNASDEKDRATQYADWALGYFMKEAKKQKWYENTVFLFLGDHGLSMGHTYEMPISYHHIPFVVHCPKYIPSDTISNLGYQPDVVATVMGILNKSYKNESFGIDLFKASHPFVLITADDKLGCVDNKGNYYYELQSTGVKRLRRYENLDQTDYYNTRKNLADSLEYGAKSVLETARYLIRQKYFVY